MTRVAADLGARISNRASRSRVVTRLLRLMPASLALAWLGILWAGLALHPDLRSDAHGYWLAAQPGADAYGRAWSVQADAYVYPPPFLQLIMPAARLFDWPTFHALWTALLFGGVVWIAGPLWAALLLIPLRGWPVWESAIWGNIEIPLTIFMLVALRFPAAWSGLLLTKVTPGVSILWHAARKEWRALVIGLTTALGVSLVSFLIAPNLWSDWFRLLATSTYHQPFGVPLWLRVPLAAIVVLLGGKSDRKWTIPAACVVAHPAIWVNTLAIPILYAAHHTWRTLRR